jgi:hypothetical protein
MQTNLKKPSVPFTACWSEPEFFFHLERPMPNEYR